MEVVVIFAFKIHPVYVLWVPELVLDMATKRKFLPLTRMKSWSSSSLLVALLNELSRLTQIAQEN
jgi:hypothetical protein